MVLILMALVVLSFMVLVLTIVALVYWWLDGGHRHDVAIVVGVLLSDNVI